MSDQTQVDPNAGQDPSQELPQPDPNVAPTFPKSIEDIALEVIDGQWGVGQDRRNRLHAAGYNFREIDAQIQQIRNDTAASSHP